MSDHELRDVCPRWWFGHGMNVARCRCGWESHPTPRTEVARALHGEHVAYLSEGPKVVRDGDE